MTPEDLDIDLARLDRHEKLLAIWRELPTAELLCDLSVLAQLAMFKQRQELLAARRQ